MNTMKVKQQPSATEPLIPLQIKLRPQTRETLKQIAAENGLSLNDVGTMAIASGLSIVQRKLREIHQSEPAKAA